MPNLFAIYITPAAVLSFIAKIASGLFRELRTSAVISLAFSFVSQS